MKTSLCEGKATGFGGLNDSGTFGKDKGGDKPSKESSVISDLGVAGSAVGNVGLFVFRLLGGGKIPLWNFENARGSGNYNSLKKQA